MNRITLKDLVQIKKVPEEDDLFLIVQTPEQIKEFKEARIDGWVPVLVAQMPENLEPSQRERVYSKLNKRIKAERVGDAFAILHGEKEKYKILETSKELSEILSKNEIISLKNPKEDLAYRVIDDIWMHNEYRESEYHTMLSSKFYCAIIQLYKKLV